MPNWSEMFAFSAPVFELVIRGTIMFLVLFTLLRVVGKREAGVHSLTDLLVVVLVAQAAAHGMSTESRSIADSTVLIATILLWSVALDAIAYRWRPLGRLLKPAPSALVMDGVINQRALRREFMSRDELMAELRLHGVTDPSTVKRAYLEANGMISIVKTDPGELEEPPKPAVPG